MSLNLSVHLAGIPFELRIKGKEGIARAFYCVVVKKRILMLHVFTKKSQKIPKKELELAMARLKEVKGNVIARQKSGLTQAQIAERMGTKSPAITRLESSLTSGKHSPSLATIKKYAEAVGYHLEIKFVQK